MHCLALIMQEWPMTTTQRRFAYWIIYQRFCYRATSFAVQAAFSFLLRSASSQPTACRHVAAWHAHLSTTCPQQRLRLDCCVMWQRHFCVCSRPDFFPILCLEKWAEFSWSDCRNQICSVSVAWRRQKNQPTGKSRRMQHRASHQC